MDYHTVLTMVLRAHEPLAHAELNYQQAPIGMTHTVHYRTHILLQSAIMKISGNHKKHCQAPILFDTGSLTTFITQDMKNNLELETIGKELPEQKEKLLHCGIDAVDKFRKYQHKSTTPFIYPPLSANIPTPPN